MSKTSNTSTVGSSNVLDVKNIALFQREGRMWALLVIVSLQPREGERMTCVVNGVQKPFVHEYQNLIIKI